MHEHTHTLHLISKLFFFSSCTPEPGGQVWFTSHNRTVRVSQQSSQYSNTVEALPQVLPVVV